jgi:hypothetical protein
LHAVAKSQSAVPNLESRLSDAQHSVNAGNVQADTVVPGYKWGFDLDVHVKRSDVEGGETKP